MNTRAMLLSDLYKQIAGATPAVSVSQPGWRIGIGKSTTDNADGRTLTTWWLITEGPLELESAVEYSDFIAASAGMDAFLDANLIGGN